MITPDEFYEKAKEISKIPPQLDGNLAALDLMYEVLAELGYDKGVEILRNYF